MKVSVIIPCYNAADTLHIQLEAFVKQQWNEPWEIIISDNGSTDATRLIAGKYADVLPHLQIIDSSKVRGPAHARNKGAQAACGESLLFCDADDEVAEGWLAEMGNALENHNFVTCRFEPLKLSSTWALKTRMCPQENGVQTYDYPPFLPHAASAGIGIKRWIHEKVGGFDETMPMLEDTDYCWRVQLSGNKLVFVKNALIHYRMRGSIHTMLRQARLWGEYNVFLYKKYRSLGMQQLSKKAGIKKTWRLLKRLPFYIATQDKRLKWLWEFAWQYGRAVGSVKHRVFAL